ncbi:MAG: hypothetical protein F6K42_05770 [Leptolyngbya sp. SIO1D8]|nr:hypothetical protein [Leptolyngbya sp. SIO1D8]
MPIQLGDRQLNDAVYRIRRRAERAQELSLNWELACPFQSGRKVPKIW